MSKNIESTYIELEVRLNTLPCTDQLIHILNVCTETCEGKKCAMVEFIEECFKAKKWIEKKNKELGRV